MNEPLAVSTTAWVPGGDGRLAAGLVAAGAFAAAAPDAWPGRGGFRGR